MSRASRRSTEQKFHDEFADMSIEDQASALKLMNYEHDQAKRRAERKPPASETVAAPPAEGERKPAQSELSPAVEEQHPAAQHYRELETTGEPHE